jgi:hypothetical protein
LRLELQGDKWVGEEIKRVSCPNCDQMVELPDDAKAGDTVACCGKTFRLTHEWGSFAAEPV